MLLTCLASLVALSHLIDLHGEAHGSETSGHSHSGRHEHPDAPEDAPDDDDHHGLCGQMLPPESYDDAPQFLSEPPPVADAAEPASGDFCIHSGDGRSPPDSVAVLQVNRV